MIIGGWSPTAEITQEHQDVLASVKDSLNQQLNATHTYTIESVTKQVVAGMNYQFTLKTEDGKHVVAKVYKPLPHTNEPPQVTSVSYQ